VYVCEPTSADTPSKIISIFGSPAANAALSKCTDNKARARLAKDIERSKAERLAKKQDKDIYVQTAALLPIVPMLGKKGGKESLSKRFTAWLLSKINTK
jgi:hypothetical protein